MCTWARLGGDTGRGATAGLFVVIGCRAWAEAARLLLLELLAHREARLGVATARLAAHNIMCAWPRACSLTQGSLLMSELQGGALFAEGAFHLILCRKVMGLSQGQSAWCSLQM